MESVINIVEGDPIDILHTGSCIFCENQSTHVFFKSIGKKYNGLLVKGFWICDEHMDKLNIILSGKFDLDLIYLDKYNSTKKSFNLRY